MRILRARIAELSLLLPLFACGGTDPNARTAEPAGTDAGGDAPEPWDGDLPEPPPIPRLQQVPLTLETLDAFIDFASRVIHDDDAAYARAQVAANRGNEPIAIALLDRVEQRWGYANGRHWIRASGEGEVTVPLSILGALRVTLSTPRLETMVWWPNNEPQGSHGDGGPREVIEVFQINAGRALACSVPADERGAFVEAIKRHPSETVQYEAIASVTNPDGWCILWPGIKPNAR